MIESNSQRSEFRLISLPSNSYHLIGHEGEIPSADLPAYTTTTVLPASWNTKTTTSASTSMSMPTALDATARAGRVVKRRAASPFLELLLHPGRGGEILPPSSPYPYPPANSFAPRTRTAGSHCRPCCKLGTRHTENKRAQS